jgi:hypothetical protein
MATRIRSLLAASKTASSRSPFWYRIIIHIAFLPSVSLIRLCPGASRQFVDLFGYGSKVLG